MFENGVDGWQRGHMRKCLSLGMKTLLICTRMPVCGKQRLVNPRSLTDQPSITTMKSITVTTGNSPFVEASANNDTKVGYGVAGANTGIEFMGYSLTGRTRTAFELICLGGEDEVMSSTLI